MAETAGADAVVLLMRPPPAPAPHPAAAAGHRAPARPAPDGSSCIPDSGSRADRWREDQPLRLLLVPARGPTRRVDLREAPSERSLPRAVEPGPQLPQPQGEHTLTGVPRPSGAPPHVDGAGCR